MNSRYSRSVLLAAIGLAASAYVKRDDTVGTDGSTAAAPAATPAPVPAAPNGYVDMVKQNFHFKKDKDVKDDANNIIEEGKKHPTVEMYLPIPKKERLIEILQDPTKYAKEVELLEAAVFDVVYSVARGQINEFREKDPKAIVTPAVLNYDQLDWTAIANTPKAERGAYAPSDEELKAFLDSYVEVMPAATGKTEAQIKNHVLLFQGGFKKQRAQKEILELFLGMLQIYLSKAPQDATEENAQVVEYFINKLDRWLKAEEKITMDML
jgi:hypothetical protein